MHRILGQERAIEVLLGALRRRHLPHAWIFSGPPGVGKFTTAVEFARILLDPGAGENLAGEIEADPDGRTSLLVDAGTHPDLHVIRKELALVSDVAELRRRKLSNIPLDVLRAHMIGGRTSDERFHEGAANLTAALGHGKVFIVDEAELIDRTGQNALLKTLEEPPAGTYIVLVTALPERLLPTVRSRCQHVRFGPLDAPALDAWFARDFDRALASDDGEAVPLEPEAKAWIRAHCEGSPGLALLAARYGFFRWQRTLDPMLAELEAGHFPLAMGAALGEIVEGFAAAWVKRHPNASKDAANKDGARHVLGLLAAHARRRLATAAAEDDAAPWLRAIDLLREAETQLASNVNLKMVLENLVVQWAAAEVRVRA